jgi:thiosulfate/3-mercaptopyruvate sulfurtransferase
VLVDVRQPRLYQRGHIPGAVNLPEFFLSGLNGSSQVTQFAELLAKMGISPDVHVVAYDDGGSPSAARLFWMLSSVGHESISVVNGGMGKWEAEGRPLELVAVRREPTNYDVFSSDRFAVATMSEVEQALGDSGTAIVDTRGSAEYEGRQMSAERNGHIPGAVHIEWSENLSLGDNGVPQLRVDRELRILYETNGVTPDKRVIVYCQSGNRACESYLALKTLGYDRVAVYAPGWSEWGNQPDTPIDGG